ncbi:uncharacterized protein LOC105778447 [Gossypium raimondii]|uniref:Uncharacterized protein n=2 Tax=Gossypium raimondii TaxID=29730 RepID=A0A0D2RIP8_GOSRA|nr:uncharacterized protein LOC105778447 [Gossypium raimondii]KJB70567.1 hypothetical protein B456_011G080000 [Gossypium raimondii]
MTLMLTPLYRRRSSLPHLYPQELIVAISLPLRLPKTLKSSMANALAFSFSAPIRASSESLKRPDPSRKNPVSSSSWWTPLFGWPSNPDYLNDSNAGNTSEAKPRCRYTLGSFTEEKARQLRKKTMENSSFHDMMYHSAIASRLASDISEK